MCTSLCLIRILAVVDRQKGMGDAVEARKRRLDRVYVPVRCNANHERHRRSQQNDFGVLVAGQELPLKVPGQSVFVCTRRMRILLLPELNYIVGQPIIL